MARPAVDLPPPTGTALIYERGPHGLPARPARGGSIAHEAG